MRLILVLLTLLSSTISIAKDKDKVERYEPAYKLEIHSLGIADILATERINFGACGIVEAYTSELVDAVRKAHQYFETNWQWNQQENRKFVVSEPVASELISTLAFKEILRQFKRTDEESIKKALKDVVMWGPAPGVFGNMSYLKFGENGKVIKGILNVDNDPFWETTEGTFDVFEVNFKMMVQVKFGEKTEELYLEQDYRDMQWNMVPANYEDPNPYMDGYVDYPSECDA